MKITFNFYYTIEVTERHEASRGVYETAGLLVLCGRPGRFPVSSCACLCRNAFCIMFYCIMYSPLLLDSSCCHRCVS